MKQKISTGILFVSCVMTASIALAYVDAPAFEGYQPQVLVTPDNLPLLSWKDPGVDRQIDPSELKTLDLCTPGACSDAALEAGAAYYQTTGTLTAYYDEHGRLVGTAAGASFGDSSDAYGAQAVTEIDPDDPRFTDAGVPAGAPLLVGATPGAFQVLPSGAATSRTTPSIAPSSTASAGSSRTVRQAVGRPGSRSRPSPGKRCNMGLSTTPMAATSKTTMRASKRRAKMS